MILESKFKERAVILRKQGKTYSEILKIVPVAKSTLSLWLRSVALARPQKQRLTEKKREAQKRGGLARYKTRLSTTHDILTLAKGEVGLLTPRELLLVGSALYWAEGSKQRKSARSVGIVFGNTDAVMVRFFYRFHPRFHASIV